MKTIRLCRQSPNHGDYEKSNSQTQFTNTAPVCALLGDAFVTEHQLINKLLYTAFFPTYSGSFSGQQHDIHIATIKIKMAKTRAPTKQQNKMKQIKYMTSGMTNRIQPM